MIKKLGIEHLDLVFEILKQDSIRGYNGLFAETERPWISNFITNPDCFTFGLWYDDKLVSVLISEKLTFGGCIIWYIATDSNKQNLGFGSKLLNYFETYIKEIGIEWVFLNATKNSLKFYSKRNYITSPHSKVYEHVKNL